MRLQQSELPQEGKDHCKEGTEEEDVEETLWGWTEGAGRKNREAQRWVLEMPMETGFRCPSLPQLRSVPGRQHKVSLS